MNYLTQFPEETFEEMDEVAQNLFSVRLDHDYTPLTSPKQSPVREIETIDELAETLSILDGANVEPPKPQPKVIRVVPKPVVKKIIPPPAPAPPPATRAKPKVVEVKLPKQTVKKPKEEEKQEETDDDDEDYEEEDGASDDENDSDFEIEESLPKTRSPRKLRQKSVQKKEPDQKKSPRVQKKPPVIPKTPETEQKPVEKPPETPPAQETKPQDKKIPKKEKKPPKPIPDDFALFSTPDIIRRVGGKDPVTPTTPEAVLTSPKPAKISPDSRTKLSTERTSLNAKPTRLSTETRTASTEKPLRTSIDSKNRRLSLEKPKIPQKIPEERKSVDSTLREPEMVQIQNLNESTNSSEAPGENSQEMPTAEDIRSIILNENTKSFSTSLVLPENVNDSSGVQQNSLDQTNMDLDGSELDLDQSILETINSDLISEDILYQVAKQLADNTELQNVIDKTISEGNLGLDSSMMESDDMLPQSTTQQVSFLKFFIGNFAVFLCFW